MLTIPLERAGYGVTRVGCSESRMAGKYVALKRAVLASRWSSVVPRCTSGRRAVLQAVVPLVALGSTADTAGEGVLGTRCSSVWRENAPPVPPGQRLHKDRGHLVDATIPRHVVSIRGKQGPLRLFGRVQETVLRTNSTTKQADCQGKCKHTSQYRYLVFGNNRTCEEGIGSLLSSF